MLKLRKGVTQPFPSQIEVIHTSHKNKVFSTKNITLALNRIESFKQISHLQNGKIIRETLAYGYPSIFQSKSMNLKKIIQKRRLYNSLQKNNTKIGTISKYEKIISQHQQHFSRYEMIKSVLSLRTKFKKQNSKTDDNTLKQRMNCTGFSYHLGMSENKLKQNRLQWIQRIIEDRSTEPAKKKIFNVRKMVTLPAEDGINVSPWAEQEMD